MMLKLLLIIGGSVSISGGVTFDSSQLTLTCISTGGPATTITWTRDSTTVTQGNMTVLNDPVTAQYTHTLAVTALGTYTCNVSNAKLPNSTAKYTRFKNFHVHTCRPHYILRVYHVCTSVDPPIIAPFPLATYSHS